MYFYIIFSCFFHQLIPAKRAALQCRFAASKSCFPSTLHSSTSSHVSPSPLNPALQLQLNEPLLLAQVASMLQLATPEVHSSMSSQFTPLPIYPDLQLKRETLFCLFVVLPILYLGYNSNFLESPTVLRFFPLALLVLSSDTLLLLLKRQRCRHYYIRTLEGRGGGEEKIQKDKKDKKDEERKERERGKADRFLFVPC